MKLDENRWKSGKSIVTGKLVENAKKTLSIQKRGKLNPKFLLSLNQTVTETHNGNKSTSYKNWYLTVTEDVHGKI